MYSSFPVPTVQLLAWYLAPGSRFCRLIPLDEELVPCPTETQHNLIIYPEENPATAGHFFASNGGQLHLN
jgi:hypothetical protein